MFIAAIRMRPFDAKNKSCFSLIFHDWFIRTILLCKSLFLAFYVAMIPENGLHTRRELGNVHFRKIKSLSCTPKIGSQYLKTALFWTIMQSKKEDKDQKSIQSSTTPDTTLGSDKTNKKTSHTKEPRGQPFPSR